MKKLLTALLTLAMAFTMVFATAASAEDGRRFRTFCWRLR